MSHIFWELPSGSFACIEYDAVTSESHGLDVDITEHPVEEGAAITDHARAKPMAIRQEVVITNTPVNEGTVTDMIQVGLILLTKTPITLQTQARSRVSGAAVRRGFVQPYRGPGLPRIHDTPEGIAGETGEVAVSTSMSVLEGFSTADRVRSVYEALLELAVSGQLLTLVTDLKEYENVLIKSIGVPRSSAVDAIKVSLEFKQIRIVSTQTTTITKKKPKPTEKRAEATAAEGPKASYDDDNDEARGRTIADRMAEGLANSAVSNGLL